MIISVVSLIFLALLLLLRHIRFPLGVFQPRAGPIRINQLLSTLGRPDSMSSLGRGNHASSNPFLNLRMIY